MAVPKQALPKTIVTARYRPFYGIKATGITLPGNPYCTAVHSASLPGAAIFVHGVSSTGE